MSRGSINGGSASLLIADGFHCPGPEAESTVNSSLFADDGVDWWAAVLGISESYDPGDTRSADGHVIPFAAALTAKYIVEREEAGNGNGEALRALGAAVRIIRNHGPIHSVHHEVVRVIRVGVLWVYSRSNLCTQFQVTLLEVLGFAFCLLQEGLAISY